VYPDKVDYLGEKLLLGTTYNSGIGSALHVMSHDVAVASSQSAQYHILKQSLFNWADKRDCNPPTLQCYYDFQTNLCGTIQNLETLDSEKIEEAGYDTTKVMYRTGSDTFQTVKGEIVHIAPSFYANFVERILNETTCYEDEVCDLTRETFRHPDNHEYLEKQFTRTATIIFIQRQLSSWIKQEVQNSLDSIALARPLYSIHVRLGDHWKEMRLLDLDAYLKRSLPVMLAYGVRNVFLSTEDENVVKDALGNYSSINWIYTEQERSNPDFEEFMQSNLTEQFVQDMKNLYLATEADFFVGARLSNWCRLIDEIQKGNGLGGTYYLDVHGQLERSEGYTSW